MTSDQFPISIPTYNSRENTWSYTHFETREDFKAFVWTKFKPPGELKLKNTWAWRQEAKRYEDQGYYCNSVKLSRDFITYWDGEKEKCTKGVIIDDFYLTRYYYFWLNFLPINDKKVNKLKFPEIWDSQYYFFLYEILCELEYKYSVILKKRQWGATFQHLAILINDIFFESGYINKVAASDEEFIKADWAILEEYRTFLNIHTAWYRPFNPDKIFNWQQRWEVRRSGRKSYVGNSSILKGLNMKLSAEKGVGGKNNKFFYEEAGITKTMGKTFQYIDPALKLGALTTGIFMAAGSVGELEQADALKLMARKPKGNNILPVKNVFEENPDIDEICFFVPEYWSMPPFIDKDGNSQIEDAKAWCLEEREKLKRDLAAEDYRMYISQHPFNLTEAFAWRKDSIFPQAKILKQQERIAVGSKNWTAVTLEYDQNGNIQHKLSDNLPILHFPLDNDKDNKQGVITVYNGNFPIPNAPWMTYFAGVDPIYIGKTTSSPSLFAIYVFKNLVERKDQDGKIKLEGYEIVASYVGRYDDLKNTNEIAEKLIVWYGALAAIENNVMSFINHMQEKGLQRYMATKDQLSFVSELKTNLNVYCPYGFKMNETIKSYFIDLINDYITEPLDEIKKHNSDEVVKTIYGVERIPDSILLEELRQYREGLNVDRFVAFGAGLALMKAFKKSGLGITKIDESNNQKKEEPLMKVSRSFFRNHEMEQMMEEGQTQLPQKSYFKNYV